MNSNYNNKSQVFSRLQKLILDIMKEHDDWADQYSKTVFDMEMESSDIPGKKRAHFLKRWLLWLKSLFTKYRNKSADSMEEKLENTHFSHYYNEDDNFSFSINSKVSSQKNNRITKKTCVTKQHVIKIRVGHGASNENSNQHDSNF